MFNLLDMIRAAARRDSPTMTRQPVPKRRDYVRAIPRQWRNVARIFVALGDEHRQRMLLLFERGVRLTPGQIAAAATLSRPAVMHHLKILREAGVLQSERRGREVRLWIDRPRLERALADVLRHVRGRAGAA